ncbi:NADPH-dependent F420 reductase [Halalkalibaculum sp. DA3122]|uniref:NADPH-dependent F420 reductase n=1 Tax=Halalkalibaculum sp. DA3122 TaxID=3373607 RepID=UPI003754D48B
MSKKIAIIGNGNVGSALQKGAEKAEYEVRTAGSDPKDVRAAGAWGDIIILAIPASARKDAIKNLGDIKGKILVDPTNLLNEDWSYAGDLKKSGAEQVQEWTPNTHVVKAFNTVFAQNMTTGKVKGEALSLLVAGDDADAKTKIMELGKAIGFESVDVGALSNARYLEALGFLNIQLGYGPTNYGTDLGFKIIGLKKKGGTL